MTTPAAIAPDLPTPVLDALLAAETLREDGPPLPAADAWHRTPFARQIIADMRRCQALTDHLDASYDGTTQLSTIWWQIGTIEDAIASKRPANRFTVLDEFADRLEALREDAIDAARLTVCPDSWHSHAAAYDAYSDRLGEHLDTVAVAIGAARS